MSKKITEGIKFGRGLSDKMATRLSSAVQASLEYEFLYTGPKFGGEGEEEDLDEAEVLEVAERMVLEQVEEEVLGKLTRMCRPIADLLDKSEVVEAAKRLRRLFNHGQVSTCAELCQQVIKQAGIGVGLPSVEDHENLWKLLGGLRDFFGDLDLVYRGLSTARFGQYQHTATSRAVRTWVQDNGFANSREAKLVYNELAFLAAPERGSFGDMVALDFLVAKGGVARRSSVRSIVDDEGAFSFATVYSDIVQLARGGELTADILAAYWVDGYEFNYGRWVPLRDFINAVVNHDFVDLVKVLSKYTADTFYDAAGRLRSSIKDHAREEWIGDFLEDAMAEVRGDSNPSGDVNEFARAALEQDGDDKYGIAMEELEDVHREGFDPTAVEVKFHKMPLGACIDNMRAMFAFIEDYGSTDHRKAGLHMNLSVVGVPMTLDNLDLYKVWLFVPEEHLFDVWRRVEWAEKTFDLKATDLISLAEAMNGPGGFKAASSIAKKKIILQIRKRAAMNLMTLQRQDYDDASRIEFRVPGGNNYSKHPDKAAFHLTRFAYMMYVAFKEDKYRAEYMAYAVKHWNRELKLRGKEVTKILWDRGYGKVIAHDFADLRNILKSGRGR